VRLPLAGRVPNRNEASTLVGKQFQVLKVLASTCARFNITNCSQLVSSVFNFIQWKGITLKMATL